MVKFSLFFCAFAVWAVAVVNCAESCHHVHTHTHAPAPAPSVDCSTLIFDMVDCLPFVTNGSKLSKPQGTCCAGLKTVLKTDGLCICEVFNSSSQFGVVFNITKAKTLPAACGVSAPSISKCGFPSVAPGAAPAHPPKSPSPSPKSPKSPAPSKPVAPAPAPASSSPGSIVAQAPAPGSGASSASISLVALLVSLVVATCSYF